INQVLLFHAIVAIVVGGLAFIIPHSLVDALFSTKYDHFVHELARMYGALTLAQGWVVFKMRTFGDGRIRRCISETFCIAYGLQAVALLRAQIAEPRSHTIFNTLGWISFASLSTFYGYCRWYKTIKVFELPGTRDQDEL
ncbi:unnamed protein product, partial [Choristocarpus tenellus]